MIPASITAAAHEHTDATREARLRTLSLALSAEMLRAQGPKPIAELIQTLGIAPDVAMQLAQGASPRSFPALTAQQLCQVQAVVETNDFRNVNWLDKGLAAARGVGRLVAGAISAGTCFRISQDLLLTAHHVLPDEASAAALQVEFNYQLEPDGTPAQSTRFKLDPDTFFLTEPATSLDFTVVAIGALASAAGSLTDFPPLPLQAKGTPHRVDTFVNIVQHPENDPKKIVFRENRLYCVPGDLLMYRSDTADGSSGSPLFNDEWQVVGMHLVGPITDIVTLPSGQQVSADVNEGVAATALTAALNTRLGTLSPPRQLLLQAALT